MNTSCGAVKGTSINDVQTKGWMGGSVILVHEALSPNELSVILFFFNIDWTEGLDTVKMTLL